MVASGWLSTTVRLSGSTTRLDGDEPNEHISCAPLTTCMGMLRLPSLAVKPPKIPRLGQPLYAQFWRSMRNTPCAGTDIIAYGNREIQLNVMQGRLAGPAALPRAHTARFTVTLLRWVKLSSMPSSENSRPMPLCL